MTSIEGKKDRSENDRSKNHIWSKSVRLLYHVWNLMIASGSIVHAQNVLLLVIWNFSGGFVKFIECWNNFLRLFYLLFGYRSKMMRRATKRGPRKARDVRERFHAAGMITIWSFLVLFFSTLFVDFMRLQHVNGSIWFCALCFQLVFCCYLNFLIHCFLCWFYVKLLM